MNPPKFRLSTACIATQAVLLAVIFVNTSQGQTSLSITHAQLADQMKGGLVGQLFGNLNGLVHEMTYIDEPGSVQSYTPDLSDGAWTNDDTDIEWVYIHAMEQSDRLFLAPEYIMKLWKDHIRGPHILCHRLFQAADGNWYPTSAFRKPSAESFCRIQHRGSLPVRELRNDRSRASENSGAYRTPLYNRLYRW